MCSGAAPSSLASLSKMAVVPLNTFETLYSAKVWKTKGGTRNSTEASFPKSKDFAYDCNQKLEI